MTLLGCEQPWSNATCTEIHWIPVTFPGFSTSRTLSSVSAWPQVSLITCHLFILLFPSQVGTVFPYCPVLSKEVCGCDLRGPLLRVIPCFSIQTGVLLLSCGWAILCNLKDKLPKARKQIVWGLEFRDSWSPSLFPCVISYSVLPLTSGGFWPWSPHSCTVHCCPKLCLQPFTMVWQTAVMTLQLSVPLTVTALLCFMFLWCYSVSTCLNISLHSVLSLLPQCTVYWNKITFLNKKCIFVKIYVWKLHIRSQ